MALTKTKKQSYEAYFVYSNFAPVMSDGETIFSYTVTVVDKEGTDSTSIIIETDSEQPGTGEDIFKLFFRIQAGVQSLSPYKFTSRIVTSTDNKWEVDGIIEVKET